MGRKEMLLPLDALRILGDKKICCADLRPGSRLFRRA
ncbi:hypothetical protein RLEG12_06275 (plasmid) [Rhizobium leguminosarum bv. trifolii CB782]|nr:hypothetical protein RLEG12_06275 [Rhizobium leguminosarum bv. trifolii CB782]